MIEREREREREIVLAVPHIFTQLCTQLTKPRKRRGGREGGFRVETQSYSLYLVLHRKTVVN